MKLQEPDFLDWIGHASVFMNYSEHGLLGGRGVVCVITWEHVQLGALTAMLDANDRRTAQVAATAIQTLAAAGECWVGNDRDPVQALQAAMGQARRAYYELSSGFPAPRAVSAS